MAEWSARYSTTTGTLGDAQTSYSSANDSTIQRITAACWGYQGIAPGYLNELKPTVTGANHVQIDTGGGMVDGKVYNNSAAIDVTIDSAVGVGNTRIDRIVLRCTWAITDAAVTLRAGTDGAVPTVPDLTTTSGTTYDITICKVLVDIAGNCTITDERDFASPPELAMAVLGNAANTTVATWGAIAAASDHTVFLRHGTSAGFAQVPAGALALASVSAGVIATGAVTAGAYGALSIASADIAAGAITVGKIATGAITAGAYGAASISSPDITADAIQGSHIAANAVGSSEIANGQIIAGKIATGAVTAGAYGADSITITDIGALVPGFLGRQGGNATSWASAGTTNYSAGVNVRMQVGAVTASPPTGNATVVWPVPFSGVPAAFATAQNAGYIAACISASTTQGVMTVRDWNGDTVGASIINWCSVGPE